MGVVMKVMVDVKITHKNRHEQDVANQPINGLIVMTELMSNGCQKTGGQRQGDQHTGDLPNG